MPRCARCRARPTGASKSWSRTTARAPSTAALLASWKPRLGVALIQCLAGASRLSRRRNPQPRHPRLPGRLLHLPRWRLHRAARFRRDPSPAGRARMVRHRQSRAAGRRTNGGGFARRSRARDLGLAEWIAERRHGGVNRLAPILRLPLGPLRKLVSAQTGAPRVPATSRSGAPTSTGSTASMPVFPAGAARIPTSSCGCCTPGVRRKDGRFATGVVHLWHPAADRTQLAANRGQARRRLAQRPSQAGGAADRGVASPQPASFRPARRKAHDCDAMARSTGRDDRRSSPLERAGAVAAARRLLPTGLWWRWRCRCRGRPPRPAS